MRAAISTVSAVIAAALVGGATIDVAEAATWNFSSSSCASAGPCNDLDGLTNGGSVDWSGNVRTFNSTNPTGTQLYVSAWSNTASGGSLEEAFLGQYSNGLGVTNEDEDGSNNTHTLDNSGQRDFIAFFFGDKQIDPSTLYISAYADTDLTFWFANEQNIGGPLNLSGKTVAGLTTDYGAPVTISGGSSTSTVNLNGLNNGMSPTGNLLIVAAAVSSNPSYYDGYKDRVKIKKLTGSVRDPVCEEPGGPQCGPPTHQIPEPTSLTVFGLGVLGIVQLRRRRRMAA